MTEVRFKNYMALLLILMLGIFALVEYYGVFDNFYFGKIVIFIALYIVIRLFAREHPIDRKRKEI